MKIFWVYQVKYSTLLKLILLIFFLLFKIRGRADSFTYRVFTRTYASQRAFISSPKLIWIHVRNSCSP